MSKNQVKLNNWYLKKRCTTQN